MMQKNATSTFNLLNQEGRSVAGAMLPLSLEKDDTDEEEEDAARYEDDGFVVDEDEARLSEADSADSSNSQNDSPKHKRRKKKKRKQKDVQLDEEDFSWLAENNAVGKCDVCPF